MYSLFPEDPGPVRLFQDTVQTFVPGFILSRSRRGVGRPCQMSGEGGEMVLQALVAAGRMLELVLEAERSGQVPGLEEISDLVKASRQDGEVAEMVTDKLVRGARQYWNIKLL